ncbi:MAG: Gfo/Idh/MocA family oxidoreductase [Acidobacteria bacterium]|nr:Gfo/Idh/MocA family oxidoreductase [Acidobacteriota bacterium]
MTRRGALTSLAVPALVAQAPSDEIRVAVIGTGGRGTLLLRTLARIPGARVIALCDIDAENLARASALFPEAARFADFRRMLDERKDIDAVLIATPVDTHKMITIAALEVGKHVYCEKPMALNPEECRLVAQAAHNAKGVYQAGFQLRHDPNRRAAVEHILAGRLGPVLFCQGYRHTGDLPRSTAWYFDRTRSGDNIVEQACHILDLFAWAIGKPPLRAFGSGGVSLYKDEPPGRTTMDNYALIYEFPGDIRVNFSHIYFDPPGFSGIKERVFCAQGAIDLATATFTPLNARESTRLAVAETRDANLLSLEAFLDNARGHKLPLNNAESARTSTLMAILGRKAIYEKRIVTWAEVAAPVGG